MANSESALRGSLHAAEDKLVLENHLKEALLISTHKENESRSFLIHNLPKSLGDLHAWNDECLNKLKLQEDALDEAHKKISFLEKLVTEKDEKISFYQEMMKDDCRENHIVAWTPKSPGLHVA